MNYSLKSDKREFVRVETEIPTSYKFLGDEKTFPDLGKTFEGSIASIGGGGMLLVGPLSDKAWIPRFIWQKIIIGVTFKLPGDENPIAALCRVAWIEDDGIKDSDAVKFGLMFREISNRDHDRIFDFVIHTFMS